MLCALAWIPRGVASARFTAEEAVQSEVVEETKVVEDDGMEAEEDGTEAVVENDDAEVDIADVLKDDVESLRYHQTNREDKFLINKTEMYDEDEIDDLTFRPSDQPIITIRTGEDVSQLEIYVYEDDLESDDPNVYLHHETVLPAYPLCVSWSNFHPTLGYSRGNLAAIGSFLNGIDIWDINEVESIDPLMTLGGYSLPRSLVEKKKGKKKKRPTPTLVPDSHQGEVMCLSWNRIQQEYLASGAADFAVKCWDVESGSCVTTLRHHSDKVQAVDWHPLQEALCLSASFDKTVQVFDVRGQTSPISFTLSADAEKAFWTSRSGSADLCLIATTEDGNMSEFDARMVGREALWTLKAHHNAVSTCAISPTIPGMLVSGSVDKSLKVWDISTGSPQAVCELRGLKAGSLFDGQLSADPDHPFLIAIGGSKGVLKVLDLGVLKENEILQHFGGHASLQVVERTKRRAALARDARAGKDADHYDNDDDDDGNDAAESDGDSCEE